MTDNSSGDFFITDADTAGLGEGTRLDRIVLPENPAVVEPEAPVSDEALAPVMTPEAALRAEAGAATDVEPPAVVAPAEPVPPAQPEPIAAAAPAAPSSDSPETPPATAPVVEAVTPAAPVRVAVAAPTAPAGPTREERLADALDRLMQESPEIEAAALVSLDGFTMASALPEGMQEDRVGAMSAAILGLGERAATELGRGKLSQVFIQGDGGYVLLTAAGTRAVLTCLADENAKLGLIIYDMRGAAEAIGEILG